jgi:hypothetical protein
MKIFIKNLPFFFQPVLLAMVVILFVGLSIFGQFLAANPQIGKPAAAAWLLTYLGLALYFGATQKDSSKPASGTDRVVKKGG